jgi:molybdenum cofactor cytidylyltransferase
VNLAAIILAAGASRRMGTPKALLRIGGETFLDRTIRLYAGLCSPVVVVLGADQDAVRHGLTLAAQAQLVVNERWPLGQLSSLQCAIGKLPPAADGCLFTPVDCPRVRTSTIQALVRAFGESSPPPLVVAPRYGGRRGHPVGCSRELFADLLSLAPEQSAREVVHGHPERTCLVDVDDAGILDDVDTIEDYRRMETMFSS